MKATVSLDEFRKNLAEIVARVMYGDQMFVVRKHNKAGVIVMSQREYDNSRDPRKRFGSRADWDEFFVLTNKIRARMAENELKDLEKAVEQEVRTVRAEKRPKVG